MTRKVEVDLNDLLDLVHVAEDYGWNGVLLCALADMMGRSLTEDEIELFAASFLTEEMRAKGYEEEDANIARERLTAFRKQYCKPTGEK